MKRGRIPQGMRGLKYHPPIMFVAYQGESHPARDAWIEIKVARYCIYDTSSRIPQGMRGLKFIDPARYGDVARSHPARDAWIEIVYDFLDELERRKVASRKGCVD